MGALGVVEVEIVPEADSGFPAILVRLEIDLFVLHRPPQPFNEQVIVVAPFAVHADPDAVLLQRVGEYLAGELGALVGVEYLGPALFERLLQAQRPNAFSKKSLSTLSLPICWYSWPIRRASSFFF